MRHEQTNKLEKTIRGADILFKIKAPYGATLEPLFEKVAELFAWIAKDKDQLSLFDDNGEPADPTREAPEPDGDPPSEE